MAKYREKRPTIEAVQLTWESWGEVCEFADVGSLEDGKPTGTDKDIEGSPLPDGGPGLFIPTTDGLELASPGDWLIKDGSGLYPCKPDAFELLYELVK